MKYPVAIVGAGLSGLHTASMLNERGVSCKLIEARDRIGGRILTERWPAGGPTPIAVDLGPAWFWPHQSRIRRLIDELGLTNRVFEQASTGSALYEDHSGEVQKGFQGLSMAGSYRLDGGIATLTEQLAARLAPDTVELGASVSRIARSENALSITHNCNGAQNQIIADRVIVALPPRVALNTIQFDPPLTSSKTNLLQTIPTWMAGQAKFVALYDQPFWRAAGLSGDAYSHRGPLQEIHDASPNTDSAGALFGFVGLTPSERHANAARIKELATVQLARLFGFAAKQPRAAFFQDWSNEQYTATNQDQQIPAAHPNYPSAPITPDWNDRLFWSGSETAPGSGQNAGYLEGALESAQSVVGHLDQSA